MWKERGRERRYDGELLIARLRVNPTLVCLGIGDYFVLVRKLFDDRVELGTQCVRKWVRGQVFLAVLPQ